MYDKPSIILYYIHTVCMLLYEKCVVVKRWLVKMKRFNGLNAEGLVFDPSENVDIKQTERI